MKKLKSLDVMNWFEFDEDCFCVKCKLFLKNGQSRYCIECAKETKNKYRRELVRKNRYISKYNKIRQSIFERDNFKCTICQREFDLIIHHKDGSGDQGANLDANNKPENLLTLCNMCHLKVHKRSNKL